MNDTHLLKGKWIAIDGCDAVGKTTQVNLLKESLSAEESVTVLSEFSESPVGTMIKRIIGQQRFFALHHSRVTPTADALAILADFAFQSETNVRKAFENNNIVISDRGLLSIIAYQAKRMEMYSGRSLQDSIHQVKRIVKCCLENLPRPDIHIHLFLREDEMRARIDARDTTTINKEELSFLTEVQFLMKEVGNEMNAIILDVTGLERMEVTKNLLSIATNKLNY